MIIKDGWLYQADGFELIHDPIPKDNVSSRPAYHMHPQGYTIHNFGNAHLAKDVTEYVDDTTETKSWHITVGDGVVYQELPINENAWHAGDGANGFGNRCTIGIEIQETEAAVRTAIMFLGQFTRALGWTDVAKRMYTHKHHSGKHCPRYLLHRWDSFVADVVSATREPSHWAEPHYTYLKTNWLETLEKRYDDPMTRGEALSLLARVLQRVMVYMRKLIKGEDVNVD